MNTFDTRYMELKIKNLKSIISKKKTITATAKEMNVSRQSVHKWLLRYKRYGAAGLLRKQSKRRTVACNRTPEVLEQIVIKLAQTHWNDGVQTLADHLQHEHNITLHPVTIWRILKRCGCRYTTRYPHTRKQWKKRPYTHQTPGRELQMDTKYPFGYKQGRVIYTIIDDATRWVYAHGYTKATKDNTLDFLAKVRTKAPFPIQKIRTDNGKEFIANTVKQYLANHNIQHRTNTPYCPEENGKIERFHRTLNQKWLPFGINSSLTLDEFQYQLKLFLHYYNFRKKHRGLGMNGLTPIEKLVDKSVTLQLQCYKN